MPDVVDPIDRSLMDESVSPADDFFRHVNGGWLDANPVPPEYPRWGAFDELNRANQELLHALLAAAAAGDAPEGSAERLVGDYVAAGMDEAAIEAADLEPIRELLESIDAVASSDDALALATTLQRGPGSPLFRVSVDPDFEDSSAYLVYIGEGGLGLPDRDYYLKDDERSVAIQDAYLAHVAAQLANLGQAADAALTDAEAVVAFERRLAEVTLTKEEQRQPTVICNRHLVVKLDELMPMHSMSPLAVALGVTQPSVNIDNAAFFRELDHALAETSVETLRAYLRWHVVRGVASALPARFADEAFAFYGRILQGQQEPKPRWRRVLDGAAADIGEAVARLYVGAAFPPSAKARCEQLVEHLLGAMGRSIRAASWMGEETREQALAKLAGFTYKIGYPDTWRDYTAAGIGRDSWATNRLRATAFEYGRVFGRLGEPVDKAEWQIPAHVVNAGYDPLQNQIVFPAGILQPPFFYADADDAVNYGAIGVVIGHEITHGFDDTGSQFDRVGALRNWWTDEDRAEFERRAQLIRDQADAYEVADGVHVNGELTIGENIADLGGLTIAWDALHDVLPADAPAIGGFTPAQRFFLSFATMWRTNITEAYARVLAQVDPHAPARFRVNGPAANFPAFATAFDVPEGSPMRRSGELLAKIW